MKAFTSQTDTKAGYSSVTTPRYAVLCAARVVLHCCWCSTLAQLVFCQVLHERFVPVVKQYCTLFAVENRKYHHRTHNVASFRRSPVIRHVCDQTAGVVYYCCRPLQSCLVWCGYFGVVSRFRHLMLTCGMILTGRLPCLYGIYRVTLSSPVLSCLLLSFPIISHVAVRTAPSISTWTPPLARLTGLLLTSFSKTARSSTSAPTPKQVRGTASWFSVNRRFDVRIAMMDAIHGSRYSNTLYQS